MLDLGNKVNVMTLASADQLGLKMQRTDVSAQKIDRSSLKTYGIVIAVFQVLDKLSCFRFFQKTFSLANINIKIVLYMLFLNLSNANIQFAEKKLIYRTYTIEKALPITCQVKLKKRKEFAKAALKENINAFIMNISYLRSKMTIYQVKKAQMALLLIKKVIVPTK